VFLISPATPVLIISLVVSVSSPRQVSLQQNDQLTGAYFKIPSNLSMAVPATHIEVKVKVKQTPYGPEQAQNFQEVESPRF